MMSIAKWFVVRKPSTGGIHVVAKSASQIQPLNFCGRYKYVVLYSPEPLFLSEG